MNEPQERPATIRIESKLEHAIDVPRPGPGKSIAGYVRIPARGEKTEFGTGVVETDALDAVTLGRLRHHYDWRPTDAKLALKKKEELSADQIVNVGLLKITVLPAGSRPTEGKQTKAA